MCCPPMKTCDLSVFFVPPQDTSLLKMKMSCSDFGSVFLFSQELGSQMGLTEFPPDEDLL